MNSAGAVHILYEESNPNDPEMEEHRSIYREMTSSFGAADAGTRQEREDEVQPNQKSNR